MDTRTEEPAEPPPAAHMYLNPVMPAADAHAFSLSKNVYLERAGGFFGYQGENIDLQVYQTSDGRYSLKLGEGENIEFSKMTVGFPKGNKAWGGGYFSQGEPIPKHQTLQLILDTDQGKKKYNVAFASPHNINDFLMNFKQRHAEDSDIFTVRKGVIGGNADTRDGTESLHGVNDVDKLREIILRSQRHVPPPVKGGGRKKNKTKKKSNKSKKKSKKRRKSKSK